MPRLLITSSLAATTVATSAFATSAAAGVVVAAPAPVLGAGVPGLLALGMAGAGYLAVRAYRNRKR